MGRIISDCCDAAEWHVKVRVPPARIPEKILIAPSRNLLSPEAFKQRKKVQQVDERLQKIAQEQGLSFPVHHFPRLPITDHCLTASLHFLKKYRSERSIEAAANSMRSGMDLECSHTTLVYHQLFDHNNEKQVTDEKSEKDFTNRVNQVVAKSMGLAMTKRTHLNYPIHEVMPYLKDHLPVGEYLIPFPWHVLALVKDDQGRMTVFDSDRGTVDISKGEGQEWFLALLKRYKVHLNERLTLTKIEENSDQILEENEIAYDEEKPELTFEKGSGRWGIATFKWRGNIHQFPWDSVENIIYNKDSMALIRTKCFMLSVRNWVDNSVRIVYQVALAIFKTLTLPRAILKRKGWQQCGEITEAIGKIINTAIFTIMGTFAAFYGIFKPLDGRRWFGYLERSLNEQNARVDSRKKYYIAPCFTPINHGRNRDVSATIKALKDAVLSRQYFKGNPTFELFFGWRKAIPCCK